ncbi:MAG: segregation/condensation protein A [Acidimicrobiia bacterium]|nr:segregation/condensation protein A [Acidimicrobiia bacterium]
MPYEVQTAVFEGPFDLLLHLILREQVDLYELRLSVIVDAFLAELDRLAGLDGSRLGVDLEVATEFVLIAATLVELKTRRLLPGNDDIDLDEELALWEERDLLLARLLECKTFRDVAVALARLSTAADRSWPRTAGLEDRFAAVAPDLLDGVTGADVRSAYLRATAPTVVPRVELDHVAPIGVSVNDALEELLEELPRVGRLTFRRLTTELGETLEVVVRFLAVLELAKQGLVDLDQPRALGELTITWLGDDPVPAAGRMTVDAYEG